MTNLKTEKTNKKELTGDHIAIRKMREIRGFDRKTAALIFECSPKTIEKIENGRKHVTYDLKTKYSTGYGFTSAEYDAIKCGQYATDLAVGKRRKVKVLDDNRLRRSYKKVVSKEVLAIKTLRQRAGLSQYKASRKCGYTKCTFGHIEQGRIELPVKRIRHIVETLGFKMKDFDEQMISSIHRSEIIKNCSNLILKLDDTKLMTVETLLKSIA